MSLSNKNLDNDSSIASCPLCHTFILKRHIVTPLHKCITCSTKYNPNTLPDSIYSYKFDDDCNTDVYLEEHEKQQIIEELKYKHPTITPWNPEEKKTKRNRRTSPEYPNRLMNQNKKREFCCYACEIM